MITRGECDAIVNYPVLGEAKAFTAGAAVTELDLRPGGTLFPDEKSPGIQVEIFVYSNDIYHSKQRATQATPALDAVNNIMSAPDRQYFITTGADDGYLCVQRGPTGSDASCFARVVGRFPR